MIINYQKKLAILTSSLTLHNDVTLVHNPVRRVRQRPIQVRYRRFTGELGGLIGQVDLNVADDSTQLFRDRLDATVALHSFNFNFTHDASFPSALT